MFTNHQTWAQPVVNERWAYIADVLFALSKLTGYRVLNTAKVRAWERATGI